MFYVLFDTEKLGYMKNAFADRRYIAPADGKLYRKLSAAINEASLANVSRNVPSGYQPSHKYSNRPQVEVHAVDLAWNVVSVHQAPPNYISIP